MARESRIERIETPLAAAVVKGNVEAFGLHLEDFIYEDAFSGTYRFFTNTLTHAAVVAARCGHILILKTLLDKLPPIPSDIRKNILKDALQYSAKAESLEIVRYLVKAGANVYALETGTAFSVSTMIKQVQVFHQKVIEDYLVEDATVTLRDLQQEEYFNIDAPLNTDYDTALHIAVRNNNTDKVTELLANGANPNVLDRHSQTPLNLASNQEIAKLLVKHGANIYTSRNTSMIAVTSDATEFISCHARAHYAVAQHILHEDDADTLRDLTESPYFNVNGALDYSMESALLYAVRHGKTDMVKYLLSIGADPNAMNIYGDRVLRFAIEIDNLNPDIVELLLEYKADPNAILRNAVPALTIVDRLITRAREELDLSIEAYKLEKLLKIQELILKEQGKETSIGKAQDKDNFTGQINFDGGVWTGAANGLAVGMVSWFMFDLTTIAGVSLVNPYIPVAIIMIASAVAIGSLIGASTDWLAGMAQKNRTHDELPAALG